MGDGEPLAGAPRGVFPTQEERITREPPPCTALGTAGHVTLGVVAPRKGCHAERTCFGL